MAYENETYHQQCDRIVGKLQEACEKQADGKACGTIKAVDFEDCCLPCQAMRTISFARKYLPSPEEWVRHQNSQRELQSFQLNALGGWG